LDRLLADAKSILGDQLVGLYLLGSLALGDFDPEKSDIDVVVVTTEELSDPLRLSLEQMHDRISAIDSKWAIELEVSYIPMQAIRRYDPALAVHPRIERGDGERLVVQRHHADWIIQRFMLREWGLPVVGVDPAEIIDPIEPAELRKAVLGILWWWEQQLRSPGSMQHRGYQVYAILTMCRMLYTLQFGTVVSKPVAARWAQEVLEPQWGNVIEHSLKWRPGEQDGRLDETLAFIRHALERIQQIESSPAPL